MLQLKGAILVLVDLLKTFQELDKELNFQLGHYKITISGGAVVSLLYNGRATNDVDVVLGNFTDELIAASEMVANRLQLKSGWLNKSAQVFNEDFSLGWEHRTVLIFNGVNLQVFRVSDHDLIRAKYFAFLDRGHDLEDLISMKPNREIIVNLFTEVIYRNKKLRPDNDIKLDTNDLLRLLEYEEL